MFLLDVWIPIVSDTFGYLYSFITSSMLSLTGLKDYPWIGTLFK